MRAAGNGTVYRPLLNGLRGPLVPALPLQTGPKLPESSKPSRDAGRRALFQW